MTRRTPAAGWVLLPALALLAGCVSTAPASAPEATETPAPASAEVGATPAPKYQYTSREEVTGAHIFTTGTPTALTPDWATMPAGEHRPAWYAHGPATTQLTIESTAPVTKIVWILPDGSQRIQQGDLTYYNPEEKEE